MNSVIIVTRRDFDFAQLRNAIPAVFTVDVATENRVAIESNGRRAYLGPGGHILDEMEPEEVSRIKGMIPDPAFYTLDFSDLEFCKALLLAIADRTDIVVDNDHGVVLPGSDFATLLRSKQGWDWRLGA